MTLPQVVFSSDIPSVSVNAPSKITATLSAAPTADDTPQEVYTVELYPAGGVATLHDLGSLVERYLLLAGLSRAFFEISMGSESAEFMAIYSAYHLPVAFDPYTCFLSTSATAVTHRNSAISLSHLSDASDDDLNYIVQVVGTDASGRLSVVEVTPSVTSEDDYISFAVSDIVSLATTAPDDDSFAPLASVAYFAVCYGSRRKTFYISEHPFFLTFFFRNAFNAPEFLDIPCSVKRVYKASSDTAVCNNRLMQYNRSLELSFEVTATPESSDHYRAIEELVSSKSITLCPGSDLYEVLITESKLECSDSDESMPEISFTFSVARKGVNLFFTDIANLMPQNIRIFSHQYNASFQ